jgi:YihY family inner membrane protein
MDAHGSSRAGTPMAEPPPSGRAVPAAGGGGRGERVPRRRARERWLARARAADRGAASWARGVPERIHSFYWKSGIADDVPALTYYLVLSLAPFVLGLAVVATVFLGDTVNEVELTEQIGRYLPAAVQDELIRLVVETQRSSPLLILLSVVAMLWTSSGAIGVIERAISRMLDCPRHPMVSGRFLNVVLGAGLVVVVILAAEAASAAGGLREELGARGRYLSLLLPVAYAAGTAVCCAAIYRWSPRGTLAWRSAFAGAVPAAIGLQAVPSIAGVYVTAAAGYTTGRVFLMLGIILLALWVMAQLLLIGAGLAVRSERRRERARAARGAAGGG